MDYRTTVTETEAQQAAHAAAFANLTPCFELDVPYAVVPSGYTCLALESLKEHPVRQRGTVAAITPQGFVAALTLFDQPQRDKDGVAQEPLDTIPIEVDVASATFTAVFNPHSWRDHRCTLRLRPSMQWLEWEKIIAGPLDQTKLAEFIEEHTADIVEPDGARLLEIARHLEVAESHRFKSALNLHNGAVAVQYVVESASGNPATKEFKMPEMIRLRLPLFEGSEVTELDIRLRYRLREGKLSFELKPLGLPEQRRREVGKLMDSIAAALPKASFLEACIPAICPAQC